ncbi:MAG: hypothetical protein CL934_00170 [Deltaproteobacteria bacterium]|jgi:hypothetical protein|nr:hypothetical protein [Deltaproteobacteria bacterium]|tara:strand:- start:555 stop:803 length:249 start_codon:yes stop_codon:yes gene_type:complete
MKEVGRLVDLRRDRNADFGKFRTYLSVPILLKESEIAGLLHKKSAQRKRSNLPAQNKKGPATDAGQKLLKINPDCFLRPVVF